MNSFHPGPLGDSEMAFTCSWSAMATLMAPWRLWETPVCLEIQTAMQGSPYWSPPWRPPPGCSPLLACQETAPAKTPSKETSGKNRMQDAQKKLQTCARALRNRMAKEQSDVWKKAPHGDGGHGRCPDGARRRPTNRYIGVISAVLSYLVGWLVGYSFFIYFLMCFFLLAFFLLPHFGFLEQLCTPTSTH